MAIRALVVDDSALMRKVVRDILNSDSSIEVIGTAHNGKDGIDKAYKLKPDIITMDVEMPIMDGIEAVKHIMVKNPTPVVMLSALTSKDAKITLEALSAGAIDFICKPSRSTSVDLKKIGSEIVTKVKIAANAQLIRKKPISEPMAHPKIKVLIVDDSAFTRKILKEIINRESDLNVIAEAENGKSAIEKVKQSNPDVIIMDIDMPEIDGVNTTFQILKEKSIPIIIFSGKTATKMKEIKLALEIGAVDFIPKPTDQISMRSIAYSLLKKIRQAHKMKIKKITIEKKSVETEHVLLIGASTGGPQALAQLLPKIPKDIPAGVLIVQHMPPVFTKSLADRLNGISSITVKEAKEGDEIIQGEALVAPGDFHMTINEHTIRGIKKRFVSLNKHERLHGVRPSVDVTFSSASNVFGSNAIGVILTGMGCDGAASMGLIKAKGGYTIAQDRDTSMIFGMPNAAIKLGVIDEVLPIDRISAGFLKVLKLVKIKERSEYN